MSLAKEAEAKTAGSGGIRRLRRKQYAASKRMPGVLTPGDRSAADEYRKYMRRSDLKLREGLSRVGK